jgi:hypothetical protein
MPKTTISVTQAYDDAKVEVATATAALSAAETAESTAYVKYGSDHAETRAAAAIVDKARTALHNAQEIAESLRLPALTEQIATITKQLENAKYNRARTYDARREAEKLGDLNKRQQLLREEIEFDGQVRALDLMLSNIRREMVQPPPVPELRNMADVTAAIAQVDQVYGGMADSDTRLAARFCGSFQYVVEAHNSALAVAVDRYYFAHPDDRERIRQMLSLSPRRQAPKLHR